MRKVVVTGMGVISPVGNDVGIFWGNIKSGKNGIDRITRFDVSEYKAKLAAQVIDFNPEEYMEKSEVRKSDLYTQYALAAASQAVQDSGIDGNVEPERLCVYFGSGTGGLCTVSEEMQKLLEKGPRRVSPFFIPMMISNMAAGKIAMKYNAAGSCLPVVTACSTGTNTIGEAYRAIMHGYADAVIAGGSEAAITPIGIAGFTNCTALSLSEDPEAASLPFDIRRSGFIMGEGAGALVLEDYEHAKSRKAKIYAVISGYGSTCDAYHMTAPSPEGGAAARAISDAAVQSGLNNGGLIYINAHGTGTPLNDKTETLAIKKAFNYNTENVIISSTKSMTGHMLGAAGAAEAICSVLALRDGIIPPTIGLRESDPECDLDYTALKARQAEICGALSISLGFGGHNACIAFTKAEV